MQAKMVQINMQTTLSLALVLQSTLALPQFWPHGYNEKPYPTLTLSSSQGIYSTGTAGTTGTGTGTGTAYYPTATGTAYILSKRSPGAEFDPDHPYGYPPPYKPSLSSDVLPTGTGFPIIPTGSAPPVMSTYYPTATGTASGISYATPFAADAHVKDEAARAHRQHFEGPRKRDVKPYYPYVPSQRYGGAGATGTGTGILPTGTGVMPTGTGVVPLPMPTGVSSSVIIDPIPSGTRVREGVYPTGTGGVYPTGV